MKPYLLDGEPVDMCELIGAAEKEGYKTDGMYLTSEAAAVLRGNGHEVSENAEQVEA